MTSKAAHFFDGVWVFVILTFLLVGYFTVNFISKYKHPIAAIIFALFLLSLQRILV